MSKHEDIDWFWVYTDRLRGYTFENFQIKGVFKQFKDKVLDRIIDARFQLEFDNQLTFDYETGIVQLPDGSYSFEIDEDALRLTKSFKDSDLTYQVLVVEGIHEYTLIDENLPSDKQLLQTFNREDLEASIKLGLDYLLLKTKRVAKQNETGKVDWKNL